MNMVFVWNPAKCLRFQCQQRHPIPRHPPAYSIRVGCRICRLCAPTQSLPASSNATNLRCVLGSRPHTTVSTLPLFRHVLAGRRGWGRGSEYGMRTMTGIVWRELQSGQYGLHGSSKVGCAKYETGRKVRVVPRGGQSTQGVGRVPRPIKSPLCTHWKLTFCLTHSSFLECWLV